MIKISLSNERYLYLSAFLFVASAALPSHVLACETDAECGTNSCCSDGSCVRGNCQLDCNATNCSLHPCTECVAGESCYDAANCDGGTVLLTINAIDSLTGQRIKGGASIRVDPDDSSENPQPTSNGIARFHVVGGGNDYHMEGTANRSNAYRETAEDDVTVNNGPKSRDLVFTHAPFPCQLNMQCRLEYFDDCDNTGSCQNHKNQGVACGCNGFCGPDECDNGDPPDCKECGTLNGAGDACDPDNSKCLSDPHVCRQDLTCEPPPICVPNTGCGAGLCETSTCNPGCGAPLVQGSIKVPHIIFGSNALPNAEVGVAYNSGPLSNPESTLSATNLPAGLSVSGTRIVGTPTAPGKIPTGPGAPSIVLTASNAPCLADTLSVSLMIKPPVPVNFKAEAKGTTSVQYTWNEHAPLDHYDIVMTAGGAQTPIPGLSITGISVGTVINYSNYPLPITVGSNMGITAALKACITNPCNEVFAMSDPVTVYTLASPPTQLSTTIRNHDSVTVRWNTNGNLPQGTASPNGTRYQVFYTDLFSHTTHSGPFALPTTEPASQQPPATLILFGLLPGTSYSYTIDAVNGDNIHTPMGAVANP